MVKKNLSGFMYAVVGVLVLISLVWIVNAAVEVTLPASYNNYSSVGGAVVFNVTFANVTDLGLDVANLNAASVNATFYMGATRLGNSSVCYDALGDSTSFACYGSITPTVALDGIGNISAVIINSTGSTKTSSVNLTNVRFDSTGPAVTTTSPVAGGNYSNVAGLPITINVSMTDAGVGVVSYVFANVTNSTGKQNATLVLSLETGTTRYSSTAMNTTGYPNGLYNITIYANDSINNLNSSVKILNFVIDNTKPSAVVISSPVAYGNYSGVNGFVANVTVTETYGVSSVLFNITSSGVQNATIVGVREGATDYYSNSTFNTSILTDGRYNVSVLATDSAGNVNSTATTILNLVIDNTKPTALSMSCTPAEVDRNDVVTCTCSGTDALSGVANTTYTASPATDQTGSFTETCTVTDYASNFETAQDGYIVEGNTASSGSSGGSSSSTTTRTNTTVTNTTGSGSSSGSTGSASNNSDSNLTTSVDGTTTSGGQSFVDKMFSTMSEKNGLVWGIIAIVVIVVLVWIYLVKIKGKHR